MNSTMKLGGGLLAACAACCAVSIVPAVLAGTTVAIGGAAWIWGSGALALVVVAVGAAAYLMNRVPRQRIGLPARELIASAQSQGCGCAPSGSDEVAIACALDAGDFKQRIQDIRDLARRSLRHAARKPLSLTLTYGIEGKEEVRALVAKEQECCPFLTFGVTENDDTIKVAILAPAAAAEAADALFDHFAPELAASHMKEIA